MLSQSHWPSGCSLHKHHPDSGLRRAILSALKLQLQKSTLLPPSCHSGLSPKVFTLEKVLKCQPTSFQGFCLSYLALFIYLQYLSLGFPGGYPILGFLCNAVNKESACVAGDPDSIPGSGRSPGEGNGNPLQYSCVENPMDREAWWAIVQGVTRVGHDLATKSPPGG